MLNLRAARGGSAAICFLYMTNLPLGSRLSQDRTFPASFLRARNYAYSDRGEVASMQRIETHDVAGELRL